MCDGDCTAAPPHRRTTAPPRSDIDITHVNHIENIKWHKPEITGKLFDKFVYAHTLTLR